MNHLLRIERRLNLSRISLDGEGKILFVGYNRGTALVVGLLAEKMQYNILPPCAFHRQREAVRPFRLLDRRIHPLEHGFGPLYLRIQEPNDP
jgi:hypothetical protein